MTVRRQFDRACFGAVPAWSWWTTSTTPWEDLEAAFGGMSAERLRAYAAEHYGVILGDLSTIAGTPAARS